MPEKILELEGVKSIAAGAHSSAVISDEGELYLWGKLLNKVVFVQFAYSNSPVPSSLPYLLAEQKCVCARAVCKRLWTGWKRHFFAVSLHLILEVDCVSSSLMLQGSSF